MSFAISAILVFAVSSDKGTESILSASFRPSNICAIFTALGFISFSPAESDAFAFVIIKETSYEATGVVEKLRRSPMQGAFL